MVFDTKEKSASAVASLQALLSTAGWKIVCDILDANIETVRRQLEEGSGIGETTEDVNRMRDSIRIMREIRNTPETMMKKLTAPETAEPQHDPFETADQLRERKAQQQPA